MQEWQEKLEQEVGQLREQVKRLEQQTEPIKIPVPESVLLQTIMTMVGTQATDIGVLKGSMLGAQADIKAIRESQADFRDKIIGQGEKLDRIETLIQKLIDKQSS